MAAAPRIEINPKILGGKPVVRGTRISVELLLRSLSEGARVEDLLESYPNLSEADVRAAIAYAADSVACEETVAVSITTPPARKARR